MILILGGTTEGRIAVKTLEEAGTPFYYSTRGNEQDIDLHHGIRLTGGMDSDRLTVFCHEHSVRLLIDAAHPFAEELHKNVEQTSLCLSIPVVRLERIYPDTDETEIIWCTDYPDAIEKIRQENISSLLALTGVQTIGKLAPLWKTLQNCYFRILNRDSSRYEAGKQGFPEDKIYYYHPGEGERILIEQIHPDAILTKESGISGGFYEKVEAARQLGIRVFAIRRPATPSSFLYADGEHGLRRRVEQLVPEFFPLHSGLTTGTCATAAAVAATWSFFHPSEKERPTNFPVRLPDGETIFVPVELPALPADSYSDKEKQNETSEAGAAVIKDAGDDPDITNGMKIVAKISIVPSTDYSVMQGFDSQHEDYSIIIIGGKGVGTVTIPGLGIEVGSPAINAAPRKMIEENVKRCLKRLQIPVSDDIYIVTISVPGGEEIAQRTFNPRLGIKGGISIIGTSGIVKPFSSEAFVNSIRKSMEVAKATNSPCIVISSGAKSEKYIKACYPDLPAQAFVHYGNFIGETLKIAAEYHLPQVTLGVMIGKAVKLAEGFLDTHSKKVVMNKSFIREIALQARCSEDTLLSIENLNLARELWEIIPAYELDSFSQVLISHCYQHCAPLLPDGELSILLISEKGEIYR